MRSQRANSSVRHFFRHGKFCDRTVQNYRFETFAMKSWDALVNAWYIRIALRDKYNRPKGIMVSDESQARWWRQCKVKGAPKHCPSDHILAETRRFTQSAPSFASFLNRRHHGYDDDVKLLTG